MGGDGSATSSGGRVESRAEGALATTPNPQRAIRTPIFLVQPPVERATTPPRSHYHIFPFISFSELLCPPPPAPFSLPLSFTPASHLPSILHPLRQLFSLRHPPRFFHRPSHRRRLNSQAESTGFHPPPAQAAFSFVGCRRLGRSVPRVLARSSRPFRSYSRGTVSTRCLPRFTPLATGSLVGFNESLVRVSVKNSHFDQIYQNHCSRCSLRILLYRMGDGCPIKHRAVDEFPYCSD